MLVGLDRADRIPGAGREMPLASQRLITGALKFGLVEKVGEVRIRVNDADEFGYRARTRPSPSCLAFRSTAGTLPAAPRCLAGSAGAGRRAVVRASRRERLELDHDSATREASDRKSVV